MNFSFLDIAIKSPQDLYSWNRIKSTLLLNWYSTWRSVLIILGAIGSFSFIFAIILTLQGYSQETILQLLNTDLSQTIQIVCSCFVTAWYSYKALYVKRYKTFSLLLNGNQKPQFFSGYIWKRFAIFLLISYLPYLALGITTLGHIVVIFVSILVSHFLLHSGFWGVIYEAK
jgi:hypothetical protein